jgi:spore coat protein CotH
MTHNYYLYHDPSDDLIKWIPWDNNEAFQDGKMGGSPAFDFSDVSTDSWPLLGYIYADDVYRTQYNAYLETFTDGVFEPATMSALYSSESALIESSVDMESDPYTYLNSSADFDDAVTDLINHCSQRSTAVESYLATQ